MKLKDKASTHFT